MRAAAPAASTALTAFNVKALDPEEGRGGSSINHWSGASLGQPLWVGSAWSERMLGGSAAPNTNRNMAPTAAAIHHAAKNRTTTIWYVRGTPAPIPTPNPTPAHGTPDDDKEETEPDRTRRNKTTPRKAAIINAIQIHSLCCMACQRMESLRNSVEPVAPIVDARLGARLQRRACVQRRMTFCFHQTKFTPTQSRSCRRSGCHVVLEFRMCRNAATHVQSIRLLHT